MNSPRLVEWQAAGFTLNEGAVAGGERLLDVARRIQADAVLAQFCRQGRLIINRRLVELQAVNAPLRSSVKMIEHRLPI